MGTIRLKTIRWKQPVDVMAHRRDLGVWFFAALGCERLTPTGNVWSLDYRRDWTPAADPREAFHRALVRMDRADIAA